MKEHETLKDFEYELFDIVTLMRLHRKYLVQTSSQYEFCYYALNDLQKELSKL